jgi:pyridoxal phosphate enzyme (YggS family)
MVIVENFQRLRTLIPGNVKIIVVTKTKSINEILAVYSTGHKKFGENKAQEIIDKFTLLPSDVEWHFIGHLQSNKVKYIAPFIYLIHSIDSLTLLKVVNREGFRNNRIIKCLLQFHIATEETKFGLNLSEGLAILDSEEYKVMKNIQIIGVMGMATYTENDEIIRSEFRKLRNYFSRLKNDYFSDDDGFCEISMGMSADFPIAIEEGTTMIRVGSVIFKE